MIEPRTPNAKFVDQATGKPTQGFIGRDVDTFEVRVQFFGDPPNGGCNYEWDADPNHCVEWTNETFEWKRGFRIVDSGRIYCKLTDENGFTYDVPSVYVHASRPADRESV